MSPERMLGTLAVALVAGCGASGVDRAGGELVAAMRVDRGRGCAEGSGFVRAHCTAGPVRTVFAGPGYFEGLTTSPEGDLYTSDQGTMEVFRITPGGEATVIAKLYDPPTPNESAGTLGLAFSPDGALWVILVDFWEDSRHHGLWRIERDGSFELAIPLDVNAAPFPNGIVFDRGGDLYFTESATGTIWKVARGERVATPWLQHALLEPAGVFGFGANGIAYRNGALYVVNTDQGSVVRVPIEERGAPGEPSVFASGFYAPDGLALGPWNELYVPLVYFGELIRIDDDGNWDTALETGLPYITSASFGTGREWTTAYVVNFLSSAEAPVLVKGNVCVR